MKEFELKNGIKAVYKYNAETPRIALTINMSINDEEKFAGTYSLMSRLLTQGTKKYNNEFQFDNDGILYDIFRT